MACTCFQCVVNDQCPLAPSVPACSVASVDTCQAHRMRNRLLGMLRWQRTLHAAAYQPERVEVSLVVNSSARQSRPDVREQNTHARLLPTPCIRPKALTRQAPRNSCTYLYKTKVMRCGWRQPVLHVAVLSEFSRCFGWGRERRRAPLYCSGCLVPIPNHINYYWAAFRSWLTLAGALRALWPSG